MSLTVEQWNTFLTIVGTISSVLSLVASIWAIKASSTARDAANRAAALVDANHRTLRVHGDLVPLVRSLREEITSYIQELTSGQLDINSLALLPSTFSDLGHQAGHLQRNKVKDLLHKCREISLGFQKESLSEEAKLRSELNEIADMLNDAYYTMAHEQQLSSNGAPGEIE